MPRSLTRRGRSGHASMLGAHLCRTAALALLLVTAGVPGRAHALCGDFNGDGSVSATDALGVLRAAVGLVVCDDEECDIDASGTISATDALSTLKAAVGQDVAVACPCVADLDFFFSQVWTPILTDCVGCHNPSGVAQYTDYVL